MHALLTLALFPQTVPASSKEMVIMQQVNVSLNPDPSALTPTLALGLALTVAIK